MTLFGTRDGERLIGNPNEWTFKTWIGLPLIPVIVVSTRTRWGDAILPVAAVSVLRATGITPQNIRLTWPISPALIIGIMPWIRYKTDKNTMIFQMNSCVHRYRLFYKNAYRLIQRHMTKNLSLQEPSVLSSNTQTTSRRRSRGSAMNDISDRERNLELDMINGRETSSIGISLLGAILWPVISSGMGG
jgi:hypothetical protein